MGIDQVIERLAKEWPVISGAPISFAIAVVVLGMLIWLALRWQYGARLSHRDDEIRAYRRKLDGASPDEAAQKIAALERRLDSLTPVPIEELRKNLKHAEAAARQNQIRRLVDQYLETHTQNRPRTRGSTVNSKVLGRRGVPSIKVRITKPSNRLGLVRNLRYPSVGEWLSLP